MGNGTPLNDMDRWDWLISLRDAAVNTLSTPESDNAQVPSGVIMSCSALKADENKLMERVLGRSSHYMKGNMVRSQFEALEDPCDEKDVLAVDVDASPEEVQKRVSETVARKLAEYK